MKAIFKKAVFMLVAAITFAACEDVPAPYDKPGDGGEQGGSEVVENTKETPYSIEQAQANQTGDAAWVKAYIVGSIPKVVGSSYIENTEFAATNAQPSNIVVAADPAETNTSKCMAVQLPTGDVRSLLNLVDNPANLGKEVLLYGTLTKYFGAAGIKEVSYAEIDGKSAGKEPGEESGETPTPGEAKGDGTFENPFNPVAANQYVANGGDETKELYVKGKISRIKSLDVSQWTRAQYYISEDGSQSNEFYVYNGLYLGGENFTSNDQIKAGDEVIVCGTLVNYNGTYEFAANNKIVSLNGVVNMGGGDNPDTPDTPNTGEAKGTGTAADPFNVAAAIAKCVEAGLTPTAEEYYVAGIVSQLHGTYANTFWISDDGSQTAELQFYYGTGLNGATLNKGDLKVGDKVVVKGKLTNYNGNTPELAKGCTIISINGETGNDNPNNPDTPDTPAGDNLLSNGGFESWSGNTPDNWKTESTAGNASLSKSTDAHSGSYSVEVATASSNKRLGYKETTYAAGTYVFSVYAKNANTGSAATIAVGYAPFKADGTIDGQNYQYADKVVVSDTWTLYSFEFTLASDQQICPVVRVDKSTANVFIDDASLIKK